MEYYLSYFDKAAFSTVFGENTLYFYICQSVRNWNMRTGRVGQIRKVGKTGQIGETGETAVGSGKGTDGRYIIEGISIEGMTATHTSSACGGRGLLLLCHITLLTVVQPDEAHPSDKAMLRLRYRGDRLSIL
jgi:hypothetical protein